MHKSALLACNARAKERWGGHYLEEGEIWPVPGGEQDRRVRAVPPKLEV